MKIRLAAIVLVIIAGITVSVMVVSNSKEKVEQYDQYLTAARVQAEKEIPYMAVQYYEAAMAIQNDDESIYQEYMEQAKLLENGTYESALKNYPAMFPTSTAYEQLCDYYYETKNYSKVITLALESKDAGVATEKIQDYYYECAYMFKRIKNGFDEAGTFLGSYARVKLNGLYGILSSSGSYLLAPMYEDIGILSSSSTSVCDQGEWYMMNTQGYKVAVTDKEVDYLSFTSNGRVLIAVDEKYGYTDSSLSVPESLPYDAASNFKNNVAAVCQDGKWALIDADLQNITDFEYEDILLDEYNTCIGNGIIFAKKDGKYYMLDASGNPVSEQGFDDAYPFVGTGPAAICINGKWGFADAQGNIVIEPAYEAAKSFNIGLGAVCIGGKWGYISTSNVIRIEPQFDDCLPFASNGIAAVLQTDSWNYIQLLLYDN